MIAMLTMPDHTGSLSRHISLQTTFDDVCRVGVQAAFRMKKKRAKAAKMFLNRIRNRIVGQENLDLINAMKADLLPEDYRPSNEYVPSMMIGNSGFDLAVANQLEFLERCKAPDRQRLFSKLRRDREINTNFEGVDYSGRDLIHNGYYPTPDAELYASMILENQPHTIIEVGSGYSTLIAKAAIEHAKLTSRIHIIDPQPRRAIEAFADQVELTRVENSSLGSLQLSENTLLFIDSSHVSRRGGDLPFLFCKILPLLPAGVLVHVHDVFIPYDYPDAYVGRFYNEQYLLHCLLANSARFEVVFATHFMSREHPSEMQSVFGPEVGRDPLFMGASFWFRTRADPDRSS
jgi:hypothetical protein